MSAPANPTPAQIAAIGAANAAAMYGAMNANNIALYNKNVAAFPLTQPPELFLFSSALYIQFSLEASANPSANIDWSECVTMVTYVPVPVPPAPASNPIYTIGAPDPYMPGFYAVSVNTNSHSDLADGTKITPANNSNPGDPHTYVIHGYGLDGGEVLAQMTS
jgi:hypothetical protein